MTEKEFENLIAHLNANLEANIEDYEHLPNKYFGDVYGKKYYFSQLNLEKTAPWHPRNGLHFEIVYSPGAKKIKFMIDSEFPTSYESINKLKTYIENDKNRRAMSFLKDIIFYNADFPGTGHTYIRSIIRWDLENGDNNKIMDGIATLLKQGGENE